MGLSVLTLARGRRKHLQRLIEGLSRSETAPDELLIVDMGGPPMEIPNAPFQIRTLSLKNNGLALAQARNLAASQARHEHLVFLDVDCIPMASLIGAMRRTIRTVDALVCAEILYLNKTVIKDDWQEHILRQNAATHPVRFFPLSGTRVERNPGLFWSLAFAISATLFKHIGRFDEEFIGYGGEDTDFGFRASAAGVDLLFLGGTGAFHQYHENLDPPLQHFEDIIRNAQIFYEKWDVWPMEGWLAAFERMGLIRLGKGKIINIRQPTTGEIEAAKLADLSANRETRNV